MAAPIISTCRVGRNLTLILLRSGSTPIASQFHSSCRSLLRKRRGLTPKIISLSNLQDESASNFPYSETCRAEIPHQQRQRPADEFHRIRRGRELVARASGQRTASSLRIGWTATVDKILQFKRQMRLKLHRIFQDMKRLDQMTNVLGIYLCNFL